MCGLGRTGLVEITRYFVISSASPLSLAHHAPANDNVRRIEEYARLETFKKRIQLPN